MFAVESLKLQLAPSGAYREKVTNSLSRKRGARKRKTKYTARVEEEGKKNTPAGSFPNSGAYNDEKGGRRFCIDNDPYWDAAPKLSSTPSTRGGVDHLLRKKGEKHRTKRVDD